MATRCAQYYDGLERKYQWAASHPWQTVPPDPPRPSEWVDDSEPPESFLATLK